MAASPTASGTPAAAELSQPHPKLAGFRRAAIVPAFNEAQSIAGVIAEIRAVDPGMEIIVVDDGSIDKTARIAAEAGARVLRLATNLGIGGAVQTGFQAARELGCDLAVQVDGDGQHDPNELHIILKPVLEGEADVVIGSRFAGDKSYRAPPVRRVGMKVFAWFVSLMSGQRVTDTSSSFRAINRRALSLFAVDYPHGYLETVEATVMAMRYGLRLKEVPVRMRQRTTGRSSLTTALSVYYAVKVLVAVFAGMFRRRTVELEDIE